MNLRNFKNRPTMIKKLTSSIFKILVLCLMGISQAYAQTGTAGILPNAKTTYVDQNGNPLSSGKVYFYSPGTTTAKTTWQDINKTIPNTNPVNLDQAGRALIWGDGSYRQQVYDRNNNLQWDQVTAITGSSSSIIGDGLPVGTVIQIAGIATPTNYLLAYGQAISRSTYPELFAAVTLQTSVTCIGGSPTLTNISDTTNIAVGAVVEATCVSGSPTVISKTSTTVTLSSNASITLTANATFFIYGNGNGITTFNLPDYRGYVLSGRCNMGGVDCSTLNSTYFSSNANNTPSALNAKGGAQSSTLVTANLPPYTPAGSVTVNSVLNNVIASGITGTLVSGGAGSNFIGLNVGTVVANTLVSTGSLTGTAQGGTSTPFSNVQPTVTINYAIKVTPDVNLTPSYGVASIGGMTGIISCGTNVVCAGNTISIPAFAPGVASIGGMSGVIGCGSYITCSGNTISGTAPAAARIKLTGPTTFYVDPLGTDTPTCGLASGASACRQPQYLSNILLNNYDFGGQAITISLANGTYQAIQVNGPWVGGTAQPQAYSNVAYIGATQSGVIIDGTSAGGGYCVQANEGSSFRVSTLTVQNCALGLSAPEQHAELYFDHITWSSMPAGSIGIYASRMGYVEVVGGGNSIASIGAYFIQATHQGNFRASQLNTGATAFTLVGTLTCTNGSFAYASSQGDITFTQYTATAFAGSAPNCVQWSGDSAGLFQVLNVSTGKGLTAPGFFPGNVTGSCAAGDCSIDQAAHTGTTINTCGTSPSISGNDYYGRVVEGTTATGCVVAFNSPVGSTPYNCLIFWTTAAPTTVTYAQNGNQFALSHGSASNAAFNYYCKGF